MKRWLPAVSAVAGLAFSLAGCGGPSAQTAGAPANAKKIGVTLLARTDPFYQDLEDAMRQEARAKGFDLDVQDGRKDLNTQLGQVENFIAEKKDALIICPADSDGIASAVEKANAARIPVFTADIKANKGTVVSHIASDNVKGGELAGDYLAKQLHGKGKVVILDFPSVMSVRQRTEGFVKAIGRYPGITLVPDRPSCKGERNESLNQMENMLQKYPDLDGVFAINDNTALGALQAIKNHNNTHIVLVGYDGSPEARKEIARGTALKADAVQYPRQIGKETIETIDAYFRGEKVPPFVPVDVGIVDQASLRKEPAAQ